MSWTSVSSAPAHAGHDGDHVERERHVEPLQVVLRAPRTTIWRSSSATRRDRNGTLASREVRARQALARGQRFVEGALEHHVAAVHARARPMWTISSARRIICWSCSTTRTVLPMSRRPSRIEMSRSLSRGCRPMVGSSSVEAADEAGAERGREVDALRLAAGERHREAVEGEVVQADFHEVAEPLLHLFEHAARDGALVIAEYGRSKNSRASAVVSSHASPMYIHSSPQRLWRQRPRRSSRRQSVAPRS